MIRNTSNPALRAAATGLGNVSCWAASDTRVNTPNLAEVQAEYVCRRTRLTPAVARAVAEIYFDRRAA